ERSAAPPRGRARGFAGRPGRDRSRSARAPPAVAGAALGALSMPRPGAVPRLRTLVAGAALLAAPLRAAAEGEPDLFTLQPSLATTIVAAGNPKLGEGGSSWVVGAWLRPRLEVGYHAPVFDVGADLGVDVRRYSGYDSSLSNEFANVSGYADVELARGLSLRVSEAWVPRALDLGRPEDEGVNLVQTNLVDATLRQWFALPGERELEIGVQGSHFRGEDFPQTTSGGAVDDSFRANYSGGLGYVEFQTPLAERTTGFVRAQGGYRAF